MKFALVSGQRQEPQPSLSGECPGCGRTVVAKCGELRIWHWAHKGRLLCDPWWENETEWHRTWKNQFPTDWQEIVHTAEDGERHISDVKTADGWVIEFQHSHIKPEERRSREAFYQKLTWVVDGTRRKRDGIQLLRAYGEGISVRKGFPVRKIFSDESRLLREWASSNAPIFFDLGEAEPHLWFLLKTASGWSYVVPFPRDQFIKIHDALEPGLADQFGKLVNDLHGLIVERELLSSRRIQSLPPRPGVTRRRFRF